MTANDSSHNHDKITTSASRRYASKKRGKLKIFFGMCAGVGKTYSMLQTAHQDLARGADVVVGSMETDIHHETEELLKGLETVPPRKTGIDGTGPQEMNLDAIIARHPYIVLVDELAHSNAEGSRHAKRYQDVRELLDNGINVYTTLNIQNLESRCDSVSRITGLAITETVPDKMFEITDDVELIDITSSALLDRLAQGKVYDLSREGESERKFFTKSNIIALREMALRLVADRVDKQFKSFISQKQVEGPLKSGINLLVMVGEDESSAKLLRWAKTFSYTMGADIIALHVESGKAMTESQRQQLAKNIDLAHEFGAEVIIVAGSDLVATTMEVARKENITHIIVGKPSKIKPLRCFFSKGNCINRLLKESGDIDVYVINPKSETPQRKRPQINYRLRAVSWKEYVISLGVIAASVLLCLTLSPMIGYQPISFILLFVVLMLAMFFSLGPVILAATVSAVSWTILFVQPIYTIRTSKPEDTLAIIAFFVIALVIGYMASNMRKQAKLRRRSEEKSEALFHLTNRLASANSFEGIISASKEEIYKYFGVETYFILQDGMDNLTREHQSDLPPDSFTEQEFSTAQWTFKHSSKAGRHTDTLSSSQYTFFPIIAVNTKPGVVAAKSKRRFDGDTELFWNTFLKQISNAFEHHYYSLRTKKANLLYESDKLYRSLFNSISHEFRIPLAAIMGAADTLLADQYPEEVKQELYSQILTASNRLNRLVNNLLNISRLENRKIAPKIDWVDIQDLFNQVVDDLEEDLKPFKMDIEIPAAMPLVKLDFGLMEQALYNLVDNSCKYARPDSTIRLKAFYDNGYLIIQEMDRGPGFDSDSLSVLFNKFYRADHKTSGGLGLGLSIVQGFIEAHDGTIDAENRVNGGAIFTIKIPTQISYTDSNPITEE